MNQPQVQPSDARTGRDRRRNRLPSLRALLCHPRRRQLRRSADRRRIVLLDWYGNSLLLPVMLVLLLSAADAVFTLFLLNHGAQEVNPLMAYFIEKGPMVFMGVKYGLTAIAVSVVVLLNYMFVPFLKMFMRDMLKIFAGAFAAVIAWQLFLTFRYVL